MFGPIGCLADTGFRQIKVNFHQRIFNVFMHLIYKEPYLYWSELHDVKLHYIKKLWCDEHNLDVN